MRFPEAIVQRPIQESRLQEQFGMMQTVFSPARRSIRCIVDMSLSGQPFTTVACRAVPSSDASTSLPAKINRWQQIGICSSSCTICARSCIVFVGSISQVIVFPVKVFTWIVHFPRLRRLTLRLRREISFEVSMCCRFKVLIWSHIIVII